MRYIERPPHPALATGIECLWALETDAAEEGRLATPLPEAVVPDGCMELIVHWAEPFHEARTDVRGGWSLRRQPRCFVAGQLERPLWLLPSPTAGLVAARFKPAGARPALHVPAGEVAGQRLSLGELAPEAEDLPARVAAASTTAERLDRLEEWLLARWRPELDTGSGLESALGALLERRGRVSVGRLAEVEGCSPRTLERRFRDAVGLSPKRLARTLRLQEALRLALGQVEVRWSDVAVDAGYFDQSHLVRDFRRLTGATPSAWLAERHRLAAFFVDTERLDRLFAG